MNNRQRYEQVCIATSRHTTKAFSTSFAMGVRMLHKRFRDPIHAIYGFVRFADEIVDTFHEHPQEELLTRFRSDTFDAIQKGISLNPILHSFQQVVHRYGVDHEFITTFLDSMAMDLEKDQHDGKSFQRYILGSAEVVGLMCLRVFCERDKVLFDELRPYAMSLGAAFQKVNFLRDLKEDGKELGRTYFPGTDVDRLTEDQKQDIERDIEKDFAHAAEGIKLLPRGARLGVHVAFVYYSKLLKRITITPANRMLQARIRVPDRRKFQLLCVSYVQHKLRLL